MQLDTELASIFSQMPPMPRLRTTDIARYRTLINSATAGAPRYDAPVAAVEDRTISTTCGNILVRNYRPIGEGPFPLIVFYHGGGFVIGDLNISDTMCRALCSGVGAVVMSVDYRLAPEHPFPAGNDDCYAALCWAAAFGGEIGADVSRLAVAGDSAGANLAASITLRARDRRGPQISAQFLMYPSPEFPDPNKGSFKELADAPMLTSDDALFYWEQYLPKGSSRSDPDACPMHANSLAGLPPAFVAIAECDPSKDSGVAYAAALTAAGVATVTRIYAGMPHGFYFWIGQSKVAAGAMAEACSWLSSQLQASAIAAD